MPSIRLEDFSAVFNSGSALHLFLALTSPSTEEHLLIAAVVASGLLSILQAKALAYLSAEAASDQLQPLLPAPRALDLASLAQVQTSASLVYLLAVYCCLLTVLDLSLFSVLATESLHLHNCEVAWFAVALSISALNRYRQRDLRCFHFLAAASKLALCGYALGTKRWSLHEEAAAQWAGVLLVFPNPIVLPSVLRRSDPPAFLRTVYAATAFFAVILLTLSRRVTHWELDSRLVLVLLLVSATASLQLAWKALAKVLVAFCFKAKEGHRSPLGLALFLHWPFFFAFFLLQKFYRSDLLLLHATFSPAFSLLVLTWALVRSSTQCLKGSERRAYAKALQWLLGLLYLAAFAWYQFEVADAWQDSLLISPANCAAAVLLLLLARRECVASSIHISLLEHSTAL